MGKRQLPAVVQPFDGFHLALDTGKGPGADFGVVDGDGLVPHNGQVKDKQVNPAVLSFQAEVLPDPGNAAGFAPINHALGLLNPPADDRKDPFHDNRDTAVAVRPNV